MSKLIDLLLVASEPICDAEPVIPMSLSHSNDSHYAELDWVLKRKNGFFAFESALHFLPSQSERETSIEDWNAKRTWKIYFSLDLSDVLFFAEDVFANQFGILDNSIVRFNPETGEVEPHSNTLEGWASKILNDYDYEVGYSVAREWQARNGPLKEDHRLFPKIPFVLGGLYEPANLSALSTISGLRFQAELSNQIHDVPDGAEIELRVID